MCFLFLQIELEFLLFKPQLDGFNLFDLALLLRLGVVQAFLLPVLKLYYLLALVLLPLSFLLFSAYGQLSLQLKVKCVGNLLQVLLEVLRCSELVFGERLVTSDEAIFHLRLD